MPLQNSGPISSESRAQRYPTEPHAPSSNREAEFMAYEAKRIHAERHRVVRTLFVDAADENYITACWCFVEGLNVDYFWLSVHALEKYMKADLLLNGHSSKCA